MTARGGHRYGAVLVLALAVATFTLAAPEGRATRVLELAGAGATLLAAMLTSGARPGVRRVATVALAVALVLAAAAALAGAPRGMILLAATAVATALTIGVIVGGLLRLVRDEGVGIQAVFGAVAVYLLVGLTFGFLIGAIAVGVHGDYFAQGTDGTQSQRVYFSFTALTTTGFGDLTARTAPGRALAVLEMLVGQLYLVTVIAMLVGNLRRRDGRTP
jgi:ion channel